MRWTLSLLFIIGCLTSSYVHSASVYGNILEEPTLLIFEDDNVPLELLNIIKRENEKKDEKPSETDQENKNEEDDKMDVTPAKPESTMLDNDDKTRDMPVMDDAEKLPSPSPIEQPSSSKRKRRQIYGGIKPSENGGYHVLLGAKRDLGNNLTGYAQLQQDVFPFIPVAITFGVNSLTPERKLNIDISHNFVEGTQVNATVQKDKDKTQATNYDIYDSYSQHFGGSLGNSAPKIKGRFRYLINGDQP